MSESKSDATYTMGRTQEEEERLIQQSQLYDAVTRRFFREAGISSGMKVLDIGSGAGDVALAAAELVGPEGGVVGVDVNPAILETAQARAQAAGFTNVEFVAGDARTLDIGNDFDALTGRLVLMYMADPADALKQLATRLRPGGIAAFQEADFTPYQQMPHSPDTPLANELIGWILEVFERSGAHIDMGFGLYRAFVEGGSARAVHALREYPVGGPEGWAGYSYAANSLRSVLPLLEEYGIATAEELDADTLAERVRQEVVTSKRPIRLAPHVTAWAQLAS